MMKTKKDRIKQAIYYELFALISISLLLKPVFGMELQSSLVLGLAFSLFAVVWNIIYNYLFDIAHLKLNNGNEQPKTFTIRVVHAIGFEGTMIIITLPILAWWKGLTLTGAFQLELFLILYITFYTFVFNYIFDRLTIGQVNIKS